MEYEEVQNNMQCIPKQSDFIRNQNGHTVEIFIVRHISGNPLKIAWLF